MIESGSCGSGLISTTSECDAAATALDLPDKTSSAYTYTIWSYPPGCMLVSSSSLYVYGGGSSGSCSSYYQCICMLTLPPLPPLPLPLPPSPPPPPVPPVTPGSLAVTGTQVAITYTVAGDVSDLDLSTQDAIHGALEAMFACYPPSCFSVLRVTAASVSGRRRLVGGNTSAVSLEFKMLSTTSDASALVAQVEAAASEVDTLSATLGITVLARSEVTVTEGATMVVTLAAPPSLPPLPPLSPPSESPHLVAVRFSPSLDAVVLSFNQPTNQPAGCPLDGTTLVQFTSSNTDADFTDAGLTCEWSDPSTLVAYLTSSSTIKPGSNVSLAPATIWRLGWSGSCAATPAMCTSTPEPVVLPTDAPCDDLSTRAIVEACLTPLARISGPTSLPLCPGSGLSLTGAYATAEDSSGARRAKEYRWGAANGTANLAAISAHLATQRTESAVLGAELLDGALHMRKVSPDGLACGSLLGRLSRHLAATPSGRVGGS